MDNMSIIINILIIIIAILLEYYLLRYTVNSNIIVNNYKLELNRILKSCGEKLVKLDSNLDISNKEIIDVKDFIELIKLSEELFKPILCYTSNTKQCTEFYVMSNNIIYRYLLEEN